MPGKSKIEWTEATWNPVTGCTEVSPGCDHCYAKTFAERFRGVKGHPYEQGFDLKLWPDRLNVPYRWVTPRRIFVNSMSDLFHADIPDSFILQAFRTMMLTPRHTYQILTKRPSRLANTPLLEKVMREVRLLTFSDEWPRQIWLGTSIESQEYAWRADKLRQAQERIAQPPFTAFISAEPLLAELTLNLAGISWLIAGSESGRGARPMQDDWVRSLRDQCTQSGIAFFFKQRTINGKKVPLPELDGQVWNQFPMPL